MTYLLSLLDKAPVEAGATAADALVAAVKLAIAVEEFVVTASGSPSIIA
jgi:hypothetical protein